MIRECIDMENDFNSDCKVYDCNVKDYFGNKMYIVTNDALKELKFMGQYKDYYKRRKFLDNKNLKHIIIEKWGEVINIDIKTYNKISKIFFDYKMPCKQNLEILNY